MHAFAKHPSGSRPGAPGTRLPSDVLVFDPRVPRPPGPANPQAQEGASEARGGAPQEQGPLGGHQGAESQVPAGEQGLPAPLVGHEPRMAVQARRPQGEAPSEPEPEAVGLLPRSPGEGGGPEGGKAAPTGAQGIRAFLGLGPSQAPPGARQKVVKASKAGKPARAKAKRIPRRSASQQSPGAKSQEGPSGSPACHIHQWLQRTGVAAARATARTHGAPGSSNDPPPEARPADGGAALDTRDATVCTSGPPGSSTDLPPPAGRHPKEGVPIFLVQEGQSTSPRVSGGARRAALGSGRGSQDQRDGGRWSLAQEVGRDRQPGVRQGAGGPPSARALSRIFSCLFPGGEGDRHLPCREGGAWGSWSLTGPPAARGAANFRTVVTLKRGPSLCIYIYIYTERDTSMYVYI